jgi:dienelactone hydrolase
MKLVPLLPDFPKFYINRMCHIFRPLYRKSLILFRFLVVLSAMLSYQYDAFSQGKIERSKIQPLSGVEKNKSILDHNALLQWNKPDRTVISISNDGKFFTYGYAEADFTTKRRILIVQSTDKTWKRQFLEASPLTFSNNSKTLVFQHLDSLLFLPLGDLNQPRYVTNIKSCKTPTNKGEWLAYQLKDENKTLVLINLLTNKEYRYNSVTTYYFNKNGNSLLLQVNDGKLLQLVSLKTMNKTDIYQSTSGTIGNVMTDSKGINIVFTVQELKNGQPENAIWHYKQGLDRAALWVDNSTAGIDKRLYIMPSLRFSNDERYVFFQLQYKSQILKQKDKFVKINIWSYNDSLIQSYQLKHPPRSRTYTAMLATEETQQGKIVRIENDHERIISESKDFLVIADDENIDKRGDRSWLPYQRDFYLISLKDSSKTILKQHGMSTYYPSPSGRYLIAYSDTLESYFSYDLNTLQLKNISKGIPKSSLTQINEMYPVSQRIHWPVGVAGWLPKDAGVLIYDNYDVWLLDPKGTKDPVNLTAGFGKSKHIKLRVLGHNYNDVIVADSIVAIAYNMKNKYNGFYKICVTKSSTPQLLFMGPNTFYHKFGFQFDNELDEGMEPLKAGNADVWIVERQSFDKAPNYFLTTNFKEFEPLTDFNPQNDYNWLSAELVHFKQMDGTTGEGVLYKPSNFDPTKKYPVLFNYYVSMTHRLYEFPLPQFTTDAFINIPWFVSQGYLVFTPDISLDKYLPGPAAYNSVIGAAKFVAQLPYVDSKRMGIAGHSYAGGLTNYLVTHTNLFAAAFEGAGLSDYISSSLQISVADGMSRLMTSGSTLFYPLLWKQRAPWIKASPIFEANKVNTPLLMFHCRADGAVPFEQAIELFISLRRFNKKAWLLEYDEGTHSVSGKNAQDLTIRVNQFFDHYLKNAPAPKWMSKGISADLKGINDGLSLD